MTRSITVTLPPCYPKNHPKGPVQLVQSALGDDTRVTVVYSDKVAFVHFRGGNLSEEERHKLVSYFTVSGMKPIFG